MRILVCANRDFLSNLALNQLWPALAGHEVGLVLSNGIGKDAPKAREIVEWGTVEEHLTATILYPSLAGRAPDDHRYKTFPQMGEWCHDKTINAFKSINGGDGLSYVEGFWPDVIVSVRFGQIFRHPVIDIPRFGVLNLHSGILPSYRGILATFWSMLHGNPTIGCTLHYVLDGTIDTGSIIGIHEVPVDRRRSVLWNTAALYEGGTSMIKDALGRMGDDRPVEAVSQAKGEAGYYSYPDQDAVDSFLRAGGRFYSTDDYHEIFSRYR